MIRAERAATREAEFLLCFCLQHPEFFAFVEAVTGCPPVKSFGGRLLRLSPGKGHFLDWHRDDAYDARRLASLSLNLSPKPYAGGVLQFRRPGAPGVTSQVANTVQGDAVLFRAAGETMHRNTALTGTRAKTAFSGWFYSDRTGGELSMFTREAGSGADRARVLDS